MFNEVALKQIHTFRLRFLHNITWLDRHRKNVNETAFILGFAIKTLLKTAKLLKIAIDYY